MQVMLEIFKNGKWEPHRPMSQSSALRLVETNQGKFRVAESPGVEKIQIVEKKKVAVEPVVVEKVIIPPEVLPEPTIINNTSADEEEKKAPKSNRKTKAKNTKSKSKSK